MASDLKLDVDGVRLNVRAGVIMRYNDEVVIEISTVGRNSVVPGGRVKINEHSANALIREITEEMNLDIDQSKLKKLQTFENFFNYDKQDIHEIYFLYEYYLSNKEVETIKNLKVNFDNSTTYFKLIPKNDLEDYNLLPLELHDFIKM